MEAKPSRELQQDNLKQSSSSRTVEELLKMLSGSNYKKPPPVPPKPKPNLGRMTLEAAKRSLGINTSSKVAMFSNADDLTDNFNSALKLDAKNRAMQRDNEADGSSPDQMFHDSISKQTPHKARAPIGCIVYDSTTKTCYPTSDRGNNDNSYGARPIVTESPEEANNNIMNRMSNASTVEILEVPTRNQSQNFIDDIGRKTFIKTNKQRINYGDKSSFVPVVTSATDDEDCDNDIKLPTEIDVELILNESSGVQPPRTSTPTSTQCQLNSTSSSGASTATNNNRSSQNTYMSHRTKDTFSDQTDDDTLNISKDTDELTNTSAHNQSGCELVGVNDNSDPNNSKESPRTKAESERVPYTVQVFNDTTMSSSSPPKIEDKLLITEQVEEPETKDLKMLVNKLLGEVDRLHSKIANLTNKVDDIEARLEGQKRENSYNTYNTSTSNIYSSQGILSPPGTMSKHSFSKSTSTINKAPFNDRSNTSYSPMCTYSRNPVATISRNTNESPVCPSSGHLAPNSTSYGGGRITSSRSCYNSMARPIRKSNAHTSMNSLHEGTKSGSNSISPTYNGHSNRQSTSPNSLMNLSSKRDPMPYTSMLSLSSLSQHSGSTLKKASATSGSVSNLSQISNQLSNWLSISNFVTSKHQAKDILYDEAERVIRMLLYNTLITMRLPSWIESDYNLDRIIETPAVKLKLDWVHGYRGRDCRTNIYYLPTGECIYFVASIVILYNPEEKKQRHYLGHTDSIKCLAIHPNKLTVASGQSAVLNRRDKRPIVRVWDTVSLATLRVIGFNEDFDRSICCLAFSKHDQGATLAVVDESNEHTITLLDWQREKNWRLAETNSGHEPVLAIDFHPIDKYSLVAVGKSSINFWDIRGMTLAKKAGLFDKYDRPKYVLCLTFNDLGETITGDSNGNIIIWPRGSNRPGRVIHDVHPGGVFSVLAMKDGSYLTGGRDRRIVEWDENFVPTGRQAELPEHCGGVRFITYARGSQVLIGTLRNSILIGSLDTNFTLIMQGHTEATSSLAIHPHQTKYLTGGFDQQIHFIDSKTHSIEWSKCLMMPATAASFSANGQLIVIGSTFGKWLVLDSATQDILFTACDGSGTISCIKFSPNGEYFSMGSSDSQIYIYHVSEAGNEFTRIGTCVGHSAPIKEIDWSDDSRYIQSQSMNFELLFWKANNCRPVDDQDIVHDLRWKTHNCSLGFNVIGIWPDSIDSALISHCDKSNNDELLVSVTDTGFINTYKWPACYNQCLSQKYNGNVEKFNFIKFLHDDSKLIAVGAKSCVTTEWVIENGEPKD